MARIPATSRPCHDNRFPIRLVRRPSPSGTPSSRTQTSRPETALMNWRCSALKRRHSILNWTAAVIDCETSWCPENVASSTEVPMSKPTLLLLGVTGQLGNLIAEKLRSDKSISLRVCARDDKKLSRLRSEFEQAVKLDLDDPRTFGSALEGVDRVFLLTGYTFAMVTQSKTFVDAARKAKVQHLVHLGVFTPEFDCTDPHFAWHQMIEAYIKQSGISASKSLERLSSERISQAAQKTSLRP